MDYYNDPTQTGGNVNISGELLGVPVIYWIIGAALFFAFRKKL